MADPEPTPPARLPDWEAFYRDYRKPGYVPGFEVTSKLGGGAFGLVFRARKESIGKDYAIKFLQVEDTEVRQAVLHELEQVKYFAQVDHPNLVQIEDRGEVDGIPYLVMQYAGSETLRDRLTAGEPPSPETRDELLRYFLQACRGVAALHERSLVHFDLKPANVFIKGPVARVGDYGLSKLVTHSRGSLTMGRGTPYYMSPEMLQRRGDQRSDVYSMGIMLYEILCGQLPFSGDSEWEVLRKHEKEEPHWPEHLSSTELAVMQRCLQKDPDARYQSVQDLIAALGAPAGVAAAAWDDIRSGVGTTSAPPPPPSNVGAKKASSTKNDGTEEDPYTGFRDASLEAYKHARKIAREAMANAGEVSQKAAKKARQIMRETMKTTREEHLKRWGLWRQERSRRRAEHRAAKRAQRQARRDARPRRGFPIWALGLVAVFMGLVVMSYMLVGVRRIETSAIADAGATMSSRPRAVEQVLEVATAWITYPGLSPRRDEFLFYQWSVPGFLTSHVSRDEPKWVAEFVRDEDRAADQLREHLRRLGRKAPWSQSDRNRIADLPQFQIADRSAYDREIRQLLAAGEYDEALAQKLIDAAPASLAAAAMRLGYVDYSEARQFESARRLHRLLREGTGCRQITFVEDKRLSGTKLNRINRQLSDVWLWYLHEVATTPETWKVYSQLRSR